MTFPVSFAVSRHDEDLIERIMNRAETIHEQRKMLFSRVNSTLDMKAAHRFCPINLQFMLDAADDEFMRDFLGIKQNMNRNTGELNNNYLPRFAMRN